MAKTRLDSRLLGYEISISRYLTSRYIEILKTYIEVMASPPTYMIKFCDWSIMTIEDNKL